MPILNTNISQAYWCTLRGRGEAIFEPAKIAIRTPERQYVSWFDELFEGGIVLPDNEDNENAENDGQPVTILVAGPPGSGKTTLALELSYRLAKNQGMFSLYISTEAESKQIIGNAVRFGYEEAERYVIKYPQHDPDVHGIATIWGRDEIPNWQNLGELVESALEAIGRRLLGITSPPPLLHRLIGRTVQTDPMTNQIRKVTPDVLVIDSLNIVEPKDREDFVSVHPQRRLAREF